MAVLKQKIDGIWYPVDEKNRIVDAVYYVGDEVVLTLKRNADGLTDTAYLSGSGATKDYVKDEVKPWEEYIPSITAIHISAGVTSIGAYIFAEHRAVKQLVFEDSSTITHLGDRCFWRCQFGGEYSFPGLLGSIEVNVDDNGNVNSIIRPGVMLRAFASCVNLKGITLPDTITAIGDNAFNSCIKLKSVTGLRNVTSVGKQAFLYTPSMLHVDLSPSVCESIGEAAFAISPAMSRLRQEEWSGTSFGFNACASVNWTEAELADVRSITLPTVKLWNGGADAIHKYGEIAGKEYLYGTWEDGGKPCKQYLDLGCHAAALSVVFNILNGTRYTSVGQWWLNEIYAKDKAVGQTHYNDIFDKVVEVAGLQRKTEIFANADGSNLAAVKQTIVNELSNGNPLICHLWTTQTYGHAVAIVGANAATDKLLIVDSTKTSGERGIVYEIAIENLIGAHDNARIEAFERLV